MLRPFRALIGNNHLTQGFALGWYVNAPFGAESWNKTRIIAFSKKHEFSSPQDATLTSTSSAQVQGWQDIGVPFPRVAPCGATLGYCRNPFVVVPPCCPKSKMGRAK